VVVRRFLHSRDPPFQVVVIGKAAVDVADDVVMVVVGAVHDCGGGVTFDDDVHFVVHTVDDDDVDHFVVGDECFGEDDVEEVVVGFVVDGEGLPGRQHPQY